MAPFDLDKVVDFTKDYYAILGLERGTLPTGATRADKQKLSDLVERAYQKASRRTHPDFGGSKDAFLDVGRARLILTDPIARRYYESGGQDRPRFVEDGDAQFEVDWSKLGTYRQGTPEDTVGFSLFLDISERKQDLGLVPAFYPSLPEHNYQWDWVLTDKGVKLALAIVNDTSEVLRLTSGEQLESALPFKIYLCIPRASLYLVRDRNQRVEINAGSDQRALINGTLLGAAYSDYNLLETTSLEEAHAYIAPGGKLERDLEAFRNGSLIAEQQKKDALQRQNTWMNSDSMNQIDKEQIKTILRMKSFEVVPDDKAADFLDRLPDAKPSKRQPQ